MSKASNIGAIMSAITTCTGLIAKIEANIQTLEKAKASLNALNLELGSECNTLQRGLENYQKFAGKNHDTYEDNRAGVIDKYTNYMLEIDKVIVMIEQKIAVLISEKSELEAKLVELYRLLQAAMSEEE